MPNALDDVDAVLPCPQCGREFTKSVRELKGKTNVSCPICGQTFNVTADLKALIQEAEESIDDFLRYVG